MIRLLFVIAFIVIILIIFKRSRNDPRTKNSDIYKKIIFILIVGAALFFLATSGKIIFSQILPILKIALPFLTKFIGI